MPRNRAPFDYRPGEPLLTSAQAAERLAVSPKTIARWASQHRIAHVRTLGGHRRYDPNQIDRLARRLTEPARTHSQQ